MPEITDIQLKNYRALLQARTWLIYLVVAVLIILLIIPVFGAWSDYWAKDPRLKGDIRAQAEQRVCSAHQLDVVDRQTQICLGTTDGWISSYCFDRAVVDHCDLKPLPGGDTP